MKNISFIALSAIVTLGTVSFDADATPISHMYANGVVANNITVIQRSVLQTAFNNFDGTMATNIGIRSIEQEPAPKNESQEEQKLDEPETPKEDSSKTYGKMPVYGEYGDDGTVFSSGRSGGEFSLLNSNWFGWQHSKDYAKFDNFSKIDSRNDLVSLGIAGGHNKIDGGFSQWGVFGGIIMAQEDNNNFEIEEHGGHIGIYSGYHMHGFNVAVAGDFGTLFNSAKSAFGTDKFTNI